MLNPPVIIEDILRSSVRGSLGLGPALLRPKESSPPHEAAAREQSRNGEDSCRTTATALMKGGSLGLGKAQRLVETRDSLSHRYAPNCKTGQAAA